MSWSTVVPGFAVNASEIVGLLADANRRRVFAAMVLGASTADEIARITCLDTRAVASALHRLTERGLVIRDGEQVSVVEESFAVAARAAAESLRSESGAGVVGPGGGRDEADAPAARELKVMRAFVRDGRITQIPMQHAKRRIMCEWLVQDFEPGRRYSEKVVNLIIGRRHADTAAWRRALVDEELLDRDHGEYWRIGGRVDVE